MPYSNLYFEENDVRMQTARSSGPGGQNVNKRATKIQLWVPVGKLKLDEAAKKRLRTKLASHINKDDELEVSCEESRSLEQNRDEAYMRMGALIEEAIHVNAPRIPTEVPRPAAEEAIREHRLRYTRKKERRVSKVLPEGEETPHI